MENYKKPGVKNHPSTEFSDEFVDIVNEINDFISVLEVRQKELAASSPKSEPQGSRQGSIERLSALEYYKTDSGADFFSESSLCGDSRTDSKSDFRSDSQSNSRASSMSDLGKAFDEPPSVVENHYEPIANIFTARVTATATATASVIGPSSTPPPSTAGPSVAKPDLPPKPPGLLSMGEPGQPPKRVKALYNFKGSNNDEVI